MLIPNVLSNTKSVKATCREHPLEYGNKIIDSPRFTMLFKKKQTETLNAMKMVLVIWVIAGLLSRNICDICDISIVQIFKYLSITS